MTPYGGPGWREARAMRRRGDGQDQPEKVTPFAELARWIRARALTLLSPTARNVLLALVAHTNSEGEAWPSADVIAEKTARGSTRHKRETIYRAFKEIKRVGIYERVGRFQQPGHNVPGPIIFRLCPFNAQADKRLCSLLDVPVTGTTKRGDQKRFIKPVVPAQEAPVVPVGVPPVVPPPVNPDVPATGTQKGFKEQREEEGVEGKGSLRGKPYGQAQPSASPPLVEAPKPSPGLSHSKTKSTAREKNQDIGMIVNWFRTRPRHKWEQDIPLLERQGYRLGTILAAQKLVADVRPYLPPSDDGSALLVADPVAKPLLAARVRLRRKKLSVRKTV